MPDTGYNEEWRPVVGHEGDYLVSDRGNVRRATPYGPNKKNGGVMCQVIGKRGYPVVQLWKAGTRSLRTVHQLVMESFVGPRPEGMEIDHIDGDKLNRQLTNLEYVTKRENLIRKGAQGLQHRGERTGGSKLKETQIPEILRMRAAGVPYSAIGKHFSVDPTCIWKIVKGKAWKHAQTPAACIG